MLDQNNTSSSYCALIVNPCKCKYRGTYLYSAFCSTEPVKRSSYGTLRAYWDHSYLATTRFIPTRAVRDLAHYIRNQMTNYCTLLLILPTSEGWKPESSYICPGVELNL